VVVLKITDRVFLSTKYLLASFQSVSFMKIFYIIDICAQTKDGTGPKISNSAKFYACDQANFQPFSLIFYTGSSVSYTENSLAY
jgi:hypothetical protein